MSSIEKDDRVGRFESLGQGQASTPDEREFDRREGVEQVELVAHEVPPFRDGIPEHARATRYRPVRRCSESNALRHPSSENCHRIRVGCE